MQNTVKKQKQHDPAVSFDETRQLVKNDLPALPSLPEKPGLGEWAWIQQWVAAAQNKPAPAIRHPRLALFVPMEGSAALPLDTLAALAEDANADLKVYELGAETHEITPEDAAHALAYGMMAVQPGLDMLAVTAGDDAAALTAALQDGAEPFAALAACGTLPIAAACGAIIAARLAHVPVVTDGAGAAAAVALLRAINPSAADHCRDAYDILAKKARLTTGVAGALSVPFVKSLLKV